MILIFSTNDDFTTQTVISWLHHFEQHPIVINEFNPIVSIDIAISATESQVAFTVKSGETVNTRDVKIVWYRKGLYFFDMQYLRAEKRQHLKAFFEHLKFEQKSLTNFLFNHLKAKTIGDFQLIDNNKLITLELAKQNGLLIPDSKITTHKNTLQYNFPLINKTISDVVNTQIKKWIYYNRTTQYNPQDGPDVFFPSLFQKEVIKAFELRVFYFDGDFYAMAIFSQATESAKVDFRDITQQTQLTNVPYALPEKVGEKLRKLISLLGHTSCSIDLIVDESDNFYFLELNPVGQFGMVSTPCNYFIEKKIAQKLAKYVTEPYKRA